MKDSKKLLSDYFKRMSKKAARARMEKISPEERKRIASHAAQTRWKKKGGSTLG